MTGANTMKMQLTDKEYNDIRKLKDIKVPRSYGNFRNLTMLNSNKITELDIFNTLYYELFPKEKHWLKNKLNHS